MKRRMSMCVVPIIICGFVSAAHAAEHAGQAMEPKATATSSTLTPTPQIASAQGSIATLDLTSPSPSVKLDAADGKSWTLALDPKTITVWKSGQLGKPEDLKVGDSVKVRYTEKEGKKWVKSIQVVQAPAPLAASAAPAASTGSSTASN